MNFLRLGNGVVILDLYWTEATALLATSLADFLNPWFAPLTSNTVSHLTLNLAPPEDFDPAFRAQCLEPFVLRRSTATIFNLEVKRGVSAQGLSLAWDDLRQVGYVIDPPKSRVDIYGTANGAFIHLIELVRYYSLLVEEANGTLILHSAAVRCRDSDEVVAIVGAKGMGKTTTMLSMLEAGDHVYFAGDKLLVDIHEGNIRARGWPDYPHIGIGTFRNNMNLAERLGVSLQTVEGAPLPDQHKVLIEPSRFLAEIGKPMLGTGRLSKLVLPRINDACSGSDVTIEWSDKFIVPQADLFEWPHQFITGTWHGLPLTERTYKAVVSDSMMDTLRQLPWTNRFGINGALAKSGYSL